jgi:outer membrane protein
MSYKTLFEIGFKVMVVVALAVVIALQLDSKEEIVYVDSVKLLAKYKGMESVKTALESKSNGFKSNLDTLRIELEKSVAQLNESRVNSSKSQLKAMETTIAMKQEQYYNYEKAATDQYLAEEKELSVKLMDKVNDYIKRYGEQKGYSIVLTNNPYGNIAYASKAKDITDEVLAGLNNEFGKLK